MLAVFSSIRLPFSCCIFTIFEKDFLSIHKPYTQMNNKNNTTSKRKFLKKNEALFIRVCRFVFRLRYCILIYFNENDASYHIIRITIIFLLFLLLLETFIIIRFFFINLNGLRAILHNHIKSYLILFYFFYIYKFVGVIV